MMIRAVVYVLILCLLCIFSSTGSAGAAAEMSCVDFGFNPEVLRCSTCLEHVQQILGEKSDITAKCLSCCVQDSEEKYAKAVLVVDKRSVPYLPDIAAIIKQKKALKLTVRYESTSPRLLMYKKEKDTEPAESITVHGWTADTFKDYLQSHLLVHDQSKTKTKAKDSK